MEAICCRTRLVIWADRVLVIQQLGNDDARNGCCENVSSVRDYERRISLASFLFPLRAYAVELASQRPFYSDFGRW